MTTIKKGKRRNRGGIIQLLLLVVVVLFITAIRAVNSQYPVNIGNSNSSQLDWNPKYVFGAVDFESIGTLYSYDMILFNNSVLVAAIDTFNGTGRIISFSNDESGTMNNKELYVQDAYIPINALATTRSHFVICVGDAIETSNSFSLNANGFGPKIFVNHMYYLLSDAVAYSAYNDLLYITDKWASRVYTFNASGSLTTPTSLKFGNVSKQTKPTSSNLYWPVNIRIDHENNVWIADAYWARILRYPPGSSEPNLILGQQSFVTSPMNVTTQNTFTNPYDIVLSIDCTVAFVADSRRVLLFRAPFNNSMKAERVLGAPNFTTNQGGLSNSTFMYIIRLQLIDYGNQTGMLYILDTYPNSRVVAGVVSWLARPVLPSTIPSSSISPTSIATATATSSVMPTYSPIVSPSPLISGSSLPYYDIPCNSSSSSSICIVETPLEVGPATVSFNYTIIIVDAPITFSNTSQIQLGSNQQVISSGPIQLSGASLTLILSNETASNLITTHSVLIPLFSSNSSISGQFQSVTINSGDITTTTCGVVTSTPVYQHTSMSVLVSLNNDDCHTQGQQKLSTGAIVGIVFGAVGAIVIIIIIIAIVAGLLFALHLRRNTLESYRSSSGNSLVNMHSL